MVCVAIARVYARAFGVLGVAASSSSSVQAKGHRPVFSLDLSTLQESLPMNSTTANGAKQNASAVKKGSFVSMAPVKSSKSRSKLAKTEIEQFQSVVNHPVFASNPIATLQTHLKYALQTATHNTATK